MLPSKALEPTRAPGQAQILARETRIAANDALYQVMRSLGGRAVTMLAECECGSSHCTETISLLLQDFERARRANGDCIVTPQHFTADDEIVDLTPAYWLVRS